MGVRLPRPEDGARKDREKRRPIKSILDGLPGGRPLTMPPVAPLLLAVDIQAHHFLAPRQGGIPLGGGDDNGLARR